MGVERHGKGWSYRISQTVNGKRQHRRVGGFPTEAAATRAYLAEKERLSRSPIYTPGYTLEEWLEHWYKTYARLRVAETTLEKYADGMTHIVAAIGNIVLSSLRAQHIQAMIGEWAEKYKPATIRTMYEPLQSSLNDAVKLSMLSFNPCVGVTLPRMERKPIQTLTDKEIGHVLDVAREKTYYLPYLLAVMTGMRRGEIAGLRWVDVDLDRGFLSVRVTRVRKTNGAVVEKDAKTDKSVRLVAISKELVEELRRHRQSQPEDAKYVFMVNGKPMRPDYLTMAFRRLTERAGVPRQAVHAQRHNHATLMLAMGVHPKIVQERLGHSKITTTLDIYSHVLPSMQQESAQLIETAILGAPKVAPEKGEEK